MTVITMSRDELPTSTAPAARPPPGASLISMRHQHRYRHVIEQVATDPAQQAFAQLRVV